MRQVTTYTAVHDIPHDAWNGLARGADFTLTSPMLAITQRARPKPARFFLAWDDTMVPSGAAPLYLLEESSTVSSYLRPDLILRRVARENSNLAGLGTHELLPAALIGSHQPTSARMLLARSASYQEQRASANILLESIEEQARRWDTRSVCCPYVVPDDTALRDVLIEHGYLPFPSAWLAMLTVQWPDFDSYLSTLSSHYRVVVRRERRKIAEAGLNIEIVPLAVEDVPRLEHLKSNVDVKYHGEAARSMPSAQSFLAIAARERPGEPLVALARKGNEIIGFSFAYRYHDELYAEQLGFDYAQITKIPLYFELVFYQWIAYASQHGIRRIHYGPETYKAKLLRGCTIETQTAFMKCFAPSTQRRLREVVNALNEHEQYQEVVHL